MPKHGEKRWVRRKGCKNCAKQWVVGYIDDEGKEHGTWLIVPMVIGKPFVFVSKIYNFNQEQTVMQNVYFDKKGLVFNKKVSAHE